MARINHSSVSTSPHAPFMPWNPMAMQPHPVQAHPRTVPTQPILSHCDHCTLSGCLPMLSVCVDRVAVHSVPVDVNQKSVLDCSLSHSIASRHHNGLCLRRVIRSELAACLGESPHSEPHRCLHVGNESFAWGIEAAAQGRIGVGQETLDLASPPPVSFVDDSATPRSYGADERETGWGGARG